MTGGRMTVAANHGLFYYLFPGQSCQIRSLPRNFQRPGENDWIQFLLGHQPNLQASLVLLRFLLLILINEILTLERARYPYSDVPLGEKLPQLVGTRSFGTGPLDGFPHLTQATHVVSPLSHGDCVPHCCWSRRGQTTREAEGEGADPLHLAPPLGCCCTCVACGPGADGPSLPGRRASHSQIRR